MNSRHSIIKWFQGKRGFYKYNIEKNGDGDNEWQVIT
jgi:hypothetical protein